MTSNIAVLTLFLMLAPAVHAACEPGAFSSGNGDYVVVVPLAPQLPGQRYMFRDGRRGSTADDNAPVKCVEGAVEVKTSGGKSEQWQQLAFKKTDTHFTSVATEFAGRLIEAAGAADPKRPLVVMVHGSERTSALNSPYAYSLAAEGIDVFVYDKRGTGSSEGEYTQNFELLATDAAAAFAHAKSLTRGRLGRAGYFGGSQGGWVAPLAATRSDADFVAIGYGLVASPIDEDREQMISEARALGVDAHGFELIEQLSTATSHLVLSGFTQGYEELDKVRAELGKLPWSQRIRGEYSGDILRMPDDELRRIGRARFDNVELIWNYDAVAALKRVNVPILWVLAEQDREAPIETTRAALKQLKKDGKAIDVYMYPDTDHGIMEFVTLPDGSRRVTRITDGYLRLLGDWIKGRVAGKYGRAQKLD